MIGEKNKNALGLEFEVLCFEYKDSNYRKFYKIRFLLSGYETIVRADLIKKGNVKDRKHRIIANTGYLGDKVEYSKDNISSSLFGKIYKRWASMIERCYDKTHHAYNIYGAKKVYVENSWHCFNNYYYDFIDMIGDNIINFDNLDMDKDRDGSGFYSKETCVLITRAENNKMVRRTNKSNFKIKMIKSNNKEIIFEDLDDIVKYLNYETSDEVVRKSILRVINGNRKTYKKNKYLKINT